MMNFRSQQVVRRVGVLGQLPNQFGPDNGAVALGLMKHVAIASSCGPGVRTSEKHAEKIHSPKKGRVLGHSEQVGPGKNKLINETARDMHVPNNSPQFSGNRAASASLTNDATQVRYIMCRMYMSSLTAVGPV